ncbi:MAG: hypothetical protein WC364_02525 [Eubacteriales bacterium]|jgi:hypothetical protein
MLAVALNTIGLYPQEGWGPLFLKTFNDFKVIRAVPCEEKKDEPLQLCEHEQYDELVKNISEKWDPSQNILELRGPKNKLQKTVRYMFFFNPDKKIDRVFLEDCSGMLSFPWALQVFILNSPEPGHVPGRDLINQADIFILDAQCGEQRREALDQIKKYRPGLPVFTENLQEGISGTLKGILGKLFAAYLENRDRVKLALETNYSDKQIICEQARKMAGKLKVSLFLFGSVCDECGYAITQCGLGCF